jgi:hypothetical protein
VGRLRFIVFLAGLLACSDYRPPPVEYVKKKDWEPAPQVKDMEGRGGQPDAGLDEPVPMSLTKHKPEPDTTFSRPHRPPKK